MANRKAIVLINGIKQELPSGDVLAANITGNAATVTTNANLTGEVTSVGNAATLTNSAVIGKVLTGYVSGAGTVAATDTILQAIQKLNGNDATNANLTGVVTSVGNATAIADAALSIAKTSGLQTALDGKQATLVSGSNIRTVNSTSLLGSGNIAVATAAQGALADSALQAAAIGVTVQGYSAVLAATTASFTTADETKLDYITVTQAVNLDTIESDTAINNAKVTNATHTGDVTGATVLTLATVNANVGSFGLASQVMTQTVNAKGLVTAAANVSIQIAQSQVTNLVSDLAAKQATLVSGTNIKTINGSSVLGSGDLVVSGGANTALSNLASVAINTSLLLGTSDGGALGSTTKMWSDLFLASGGVINWNNGDVTLTHSLNVLAISGGDFKVNSGSSDTTLDQSGGISYFDGTTTQYSIAPSAVTFGTQDADNSFYSFSINGGSTNADAFKWTNAAGVVVNEQGTTFTDFRVESDTKTQAIFVDASADSVNFLNDWTMVSNYLNFSTTTGSTGYGIRNNAGTVERKNSSGSWSPIQATLVSGTNIKTINGNSVLGSGDLTISSGITRGQVGMATLGAFF